VVSWLVGWLVSWFVGLLDLSNAIAVWWALKKRVKTCSGSQPVAVAIDQHYNGWEKGTDKKSQIRSFS
jgi:hypothetical protein